MKKTVKLKTFLMTSILLFAIVVGYAAASTNLFIMTDDKRYIRENCLYNSRQYVKENRKTHMLCLGCNGYKMVKWRSGFYHVCLQCNGAGVVRR